MDTSGLVLAFSAGLVAAVNPCGFALLPAYLSLLVAGDQAASRGAALRRALGTSAAMTLGFVAVFLLFGLAISPVASSVQRHLPWVTVVLGLGLLLAGGWMLAGRRLPGLTLGLRGVAVRSGLVPVFLYGVGYATASLTCTIAPFLAVVVSSFRGGSPGSGIGLFLAYALGMAALVTTAAIAVALARSSVLGRMRAWGRYAPRAAGVLLVVVGGYVAYYGAWELRVLAGADTTDPVIEAAARIQAAAAGAVREVGAWWLLLPGAALLGTAARRRSRARLRRSAGLGR